MIAAKLRSRGADLCYHDPHVAAWSVSGAPVRRAGDLAADLDAEIAEADLVILLQDHAAYDLDQISCRARLVLDTRGRIAGANVARL